MLLIEPAIEGDGDQACRGHRRGRRGIGPSKGGGGGCLVADARASRASACRPQCVPARQRPRPRGPPCPREWLRIVLGRRAPARRCSRGVVCALAALSCLSVASTVSSSLGSPPRPALGNPRAQEIVLATWNPQKLRELVEVPHLSVTICEPLHHRECPRDGVADGERMAVDASAPRQNDLC